MSGQPPWHGLMPELSRFSISSGHIQPYIPNSCSCWKNKNSFLSSGRLHRYLKTFYTDAALQQSESARPINIEDSSSVLALPGRPVFISDRLYHIFDHFRILSSICGLIYKSLTAVLHPPSYRDFRSVRLLFNLPL